MKTNRIIPCVILAGLVALAVPQTSFGGLHIRPVFIGGTPPPADLLVGGGNLQDIFQVAAENWEKVFKTGSGKWDVTIYYGWTNLNTTGTPDLYGQEYFLAEGGGNVVRMTSSRVAFTTDPPLPPQPGAVRGFYADPNPRSNSAYHTYTTVLQDVDGVAVNYGRVLSNATGPASNRVDLLTIAMHEIGHSLGLDGGYSGFQERVRSGLFVDITSPPPYAGISLIIVFTGPHINDSGGTALMYQSPTPGWRTLITVADALLIGRLNLFDRPDLTDPITGQ
jgi:hypothetical protein